MSQTAPPVTNEDRERISNAAADIYHRNLKAILEPEHNGKIVAIHIDTEDYDVGRNSPEARFALRRRHPDGMIVTTDIGPVDPFDSFSLRMLGSKLLAGQ